MNRSRVQNAKRNVISGLALKVYSIIVPFCMRSAVLYILGVQYLGLNSLFGSILSVLNLAELGVGSAMTFAMYKPLAEDNTEEVCALLCLFRKYYRIIGGGIALVGVLVTPWVPKLIAGDVPQDINVYVLYLLNLAATVSTYWLFAYKDSILVATQRNDVSSKIGMVSSTVMYASQLVVLLLTRNFYLYTIVAVLSRLAANCVTAWISKLMYPQYTACGVLEEEKVREINSKIKDLFMTKLGRVITNSVDPIVISSCLGLTILAMYENYYFIMSAVIDIIGVIFVSCLAGVGNSLVTEDTNKNYMDLRKLTFIISWIVCVSICCFLGLYQPFIKLWVGEALQLEYGVVVCLCFYFYVYVISQMLSMYKDAAGIWHEDRFRPLITGLVNLCLNLILVRYIGIYGIVLSTVISHLLIGMPWLIRNIFSHIFSNENKFGYVKDIVRFLICTIIICGICSWLVNKINLDGILVLLVRGIICVSFANFCLWLFFNRTDEYQACKKLIIALLGKQRDGSRK